MSKRSATQTQPAEIIREYGPFPDADQVHGVTFDGTRTWFATGTHLQAFDPTTGEANARLSAPSDAGTAFDGHHFYQITGDVIQKLDAVSGKLVDTLPAPGKGHDSGLAWAEGILWVGQYRGRKIHAIDPGTGQVLRTIESDRFVTGVTWVDGELWHGTWENDESELRRVDPASGEVRERLAMPQGAGISGLESDGRDTFFCGGGKSGKVRAVRRPTKR
jgi:streptogramin lyase